MSPPGSKDDEEEVVQRAQHRAHAGRVEDVGVAVLRQTVHDVQHAPRARARREAAESQRVHAVAQPRRRGPARSAPALAGRAAAGARRGDRLRGGARSRAQRPEQPLEVALVVPRADRGPQPRPSGDVADDHARARPARRARPPGRGSGTRRACSARAAPARGRARRACSAQARRERARALVQTASQPKSSSSCDRGQRAGERLRAERRRVEAARVLVQDRVEPVVGFLQVAVAAARDREALAQRAGRPTASRSRRGRSTTSARRPRTRRSRARARRRRPRRRPARRRAAPAPRRPPAPPARTRPVTQLTCEQATRRVARADLLGDALERHLADRDAHDVAGGAPARPAARGAPRRWSGSHRPVAAPGRITTWPMPSVVLVVSATSAGSRAERARVGLAQRFAELAAAFEVRHRAALGELALELRPRRGRRDARAAGRRCRR